MKTAILVTLSLGAFLLAACSSTPEPDPALQAQPTPAQLALAARNGDANAGRFLVWGGSVLKVSNKRDRTLIEILSHPLGRDRKPILQSPASGRFLLEMKGFVEPAGLPPGTRVSASGHFAGLEPVAGRSLPLLRGQRLQVWGAPPAKSPARPRPDVRWNIGIGTGGSGVGVSIGL